MKRKLIAILVAGTFLISGCGASGSGEGTPSTDASAVSETDSSSETNTEDNKTLDSASIDPVTVYNADGITITAQSLKKDSYGDYNLVLDVQNNSDRDINFSVDAYTINQINISGYMGYPVSAGSTGKTEFPIYQSDLDQFNIPNINTLKLHMYIADSDGYVLKYFDSDSLVTSLGDNYDFSLPLDSYDVVYDNNGLKLYNTKTVSHENDDDYYYTEFILYNGNDQNISASAENVSFDDVMNYDNSYTYDVYANSYSKFELCSTEPFDNVSQITFDLTTWDDDGCESFAEKVALTLK